MRPVIILRLTHGKEIKNDFIHRNFVIDFGCALALISLWIRDLVSAVVVFGAYSFLMCLIWTGMGAVDVAFTEAAVGAGVSTVFFIAVLFNTTRQIKFNPLDLSVKIASGLLCGFFGYLLFLGVTDLPTWGDADAPVNAGVASYYVKEAYNDTKVPNLVTTVLADYRSFDTMFETAVVFIAMLGIFTLLRRYEDDNEVDQVNDSLIIRVAARFMTPFIQLFAFTLLLMAIIVQVEVFKEGLFWNKFNIAGNGY